MYYHGWHLLLRLDRVVVQLEAANLLCTCPKSGKSDQFSILAPDKKGPLGLGMHGFQGSTICTKGHASLSMWIGFLGRWEHKPVFFGKLPNFHHFPQLEPDKVDPLRLGIVIIGANRCSIMDDT